MIFIILQECYYYTAREIGKFRQKIASYKKMSAAELTKETADFYFRLKQYGTAVIYYEKILDDWRIKSLSDEFTAKIWNNIGASLVETPIAATAFSPIKLPAIMESAILYNCCSRLLATRGAANWNSILVIFPFVIYGS